MSMKKTALITTAIIVFLAITVAVGYRALYYTPTAIYYKYNLYIMPHDTQASIIEAIHRYDPDVRIRVLNRLLKIRDYDSHIHTGCYTLHSGASVKEIADLLTSGAQTPVRITINSTRTVEQMAHTISRQIMADSMQIATVLTDRTLLDSLGYTPATLFCMIIPNTYEVWWNISPKALVLRLIKERDKYWNEQRRSKAAQIGLSIEQVMTLASIIEEETAKADELPIVAGLYMNRLKRKMPLQADPTVIFALGGERPKRVLKKHLEVDSPYNTYKHPGLPPAPIRFVSPHSIDAVLNYAKHNYLYMCAKEDFSGYHNFTSSLSQHNANASRYQRALSKK